MHVTPEGNENSQNALGTFANSLQGDLTTDLQIGLTLALPPTAPTNIKIGRKTIAYGICTPDQQKEYLEYILNNVYRVMVDRITYAFEFTKKGLLHCHALLEINSKPDYYDYEINTLRQKVLQHALIIRQNKGNRHKIITSNYIHKVDRIKWLDYIKKEINKTPYKVNMITNY